MTDNEIIKALECCSEHVRNCAECPLNVTSLDHCSTRLAQNVLNLINRQNAEIDGLKSEARRYKQYYFNHEYDKLEAEAIKDFAERLKNKLAACSKTIDGECEYLICDYDIDNLVKEMIGEQE